MSRKYYLAYGSNLDVDQCSAAARMPFRSAPPS